MSSSATEDYDDEEEEEEEESFSTVMSRTSAFYKYGMTVPHDFFLAHFNEFRKGVILRSKCGTRQWNVGVTVDKGSYWIKRHWRGFVDFNRIKLGDILVFRYVGGNVLSFQIFSGLTGLEKVEVEEDSPPRNVRTYTTSSGCELRGNGRPIAFPEDEPATDEEMNYPREEEELQIDASSRKTKKARVQQDHHSAEVEGGDEQACLPEGEDENEAGDEDEDGDGDEDTEVAQDFTVVVRDKHSLTIPSCYVHYFPEVDSDIVLEDLRNGVELTLSWVKNSSQLVGGWPEFCDHENVKPGDFLQVLPSLNKDRFKFSYNTLLHEAEEIDTKPELRLHESW